mmetsp:Transcript_3925/g.8841  ORF Transcript_3925/g.8841 Transcript_3925/m.8841 type:complete len:256 (+) Transcript_3925:1252-2019(+)
MTTSSTTCTASACCERSRASDLSRGRVERWREPQATARWPACSMAGALGRALSRRRKKWDTGWVVASSTASLREVAHHELVRTAAARIRRRRGGSRLQKKRTRVLVWCSTMCSRLTGSRRTKRRRSSRRRGKRSTRRRRRRRVRVPPCRRRLAYPLPPVLPPRAQRPRTQRQRRHPHWRVLDGERRGRHRRPTGISGRNQYSRLRLYLRQLRRRQAKCGMRALSFPRGHSIIWQSARRAEVTGCTGRCQTSCTRP